MGYRHRADEIKTNKFLMDYQAKTTDSYQDISDISGLRYDNVVKCFRNPCGVGALAMLKVCKVLHIPYELGFKEWLRCHLERKKNSCINKWQEALKEIESE